MKDINLNHTGFISGLSWSSDGGMLATASTVGTVRIWDVSDWSLLTELKDKNETDIEEYYTAHFTPDNKKIVAAGKCKNPHRWCEDENDNWIAPCPIKIIDIITGEVLCRLDGHDEEVLCIKLVTFKGDNFLLSCSEDGRIMKWPMNEDYSGLKKGKSKSIFPENETYMIFSLTFIPNTGNKYFLGACDDGIKIFDFETEETIDNFPDLYTCYCDCVKKCTV